MIVLLLQTICHNCSVFAVLLFPWLVSSVLCFYIFFVFFLTLSSYYLAFLCLNGICIEIHFQENYIMILVCLLEVLILLLQSVGGIFFSFISIISLILFNKYSVLGITSSITEFSFPCSLVHSTLHLCSSALTNLIRPVKTGGWSAVAPPQDFCQI